MLAAAQSSAPAAPQHGAAAPCAAPGLAAACSRLARERATDGALSLAGGQLSLVFTCKGASEKYFSTNRSDIDRKAIFEEIYQMPNIWQAGRKVKISKKKRKTDNDTKTASLYIIDDYNYGACSCVGHGVGAPASDGGGRCARGAGVGGQRCDLVEAALAHLLIQSAARVCLSPRPQCAGRTSRGMAAGDRASVVARGNCLVGRSRGRSTCGGGTTAYYERRWSLCCCVCATYCTSTQRLPQVWIHPTMVVPAAERCGTGRVGGVLVGGGATRTAGARSARRLVVARTRSRCGSAPRLSRFHRRTRKTAFDSGCARAGGGYAVGGHRAVRTSLCWSTAT